jgi:hypothetical protein
VTFTGMRGDDRFGRAAFAPLTMFFKPKCLRFLLLNIVFGLLGVYVSLLAPLFFKDYTLRAQLDATLESGAFYTVAIAFLSSTLLLMLESQPTNKDEGVSNLKPTLVLIALVLVVLSTYGAVMQNWLQATHAARAGTAHVFQGSLFFIGLAMSFYCFLVATYEEGLDDFAKADSARRDELTSEASAAQSDGRGISV